LIVLDPVPELVPAPVLEPEELPLEPVPELERDPVLEPLLPVPLAPAPVVEPPVS